MSKSTKRKFINPQNFVCYGYIEQQLIESNKRSHNILANQLKKGQIIYFQF